MKFLICFEKLSPLIGIALAIIFRDIFKKNPIYYKLRNWEFFGMLNGIAVYTVVIIFTKYLTSTTMSILSFDWLNANLVNSLYVFILVGVNIYYLGKNLPSIENIYCYEKQWIKENIIYW